MIEKMAGRIRCALLWAAGNVSFFVFVSFLVVGILPMNTFQWYQGEMVLLERYVVVPWGMALCMLCLCRRTRVDGLFADEAVLAVLLGWIVVPFAMRFGITFNNIGSWCNYAIIFFGVYLLLSTAPAVQREKMLDLAQMLFTLLGLVLGSALLYCAVTGKVFCHDAERFAQSGAEAGWGFGLIQKTRLTAGMHFNSTGMICCCAAMLSLSGVYRSRNGLLRALYGLTFGMMVVVIVLAQSRTSRYALIGALAVGAYGRFVSRGCIRSRVLLHVAGLAVAAAVLVAAYLGADLLTGAVVRYHNPQTQTASQGALFFSPAMAQDEVQGSVTEGAAETESGVRPAIDATFSDRTRIWKNLFSLWRSNPRHFLIGNGVGRTGSRIVQDTIHEESGAVMVHNTYLHFIADFGLIGFAGMAVFLLLMLGPWWRALVDGQDSGLIPMCMMVVIALLIGMMESVSLGAMTPVNMVLFYAFGQIMGRDRDRRGLCESDQVCYNAKTEGA